MSDTRPRWPNQVKAHAATLDAIERGVKRLCITSPTGSGKTTIYTDALEWAVSEGKTASLFTHRKLLFSQICRNLTRDGIPFGMVASGQERDISKPVQAIMVQTELSRRKRGYESAPSNIVLVDEYHQFGGDRFQEILQEHIDAGATMVGYSVGGDSGVMVRHGNSISWMTIADLWNEWSNDQASQWTTRSFDGEKFVWKPISDVSRHSAHGKRCFRIVTDLGRRLTLTEDHSLYRILTHYRVTYNHQQVPLGELQLCRGNELMVGDYVLLEDSMRCDETCPLIPIWKYSPNPRFRVYGDFERDVIDLPLTPFSKKARRGTWGWFLSSDEYARLASSKTGTMRYRSATSGRYPTHIDLHSIAYILGFYLGDGWVSEKRVCFAVERQQVDSFMNSLKLLPFPDAPPPRIREMPGNSVEIRWGILPLVGLLPALCGSGAGDKYIPDMMFSAPPQTIREFLQGLMDSDGCLTTQDGHERWRYVTVSRRLAMGLVELLKRLDVVAAVTESLPRAGGAIAGRRIIGKQTRYDVHFSHQQLLGNNAGHKGRRSRFVLPFAGHAAKILQIEEVPAEVVYDISIADSQWQTFIASGILVHNTATPLDLVNIDELHVAATVPEMQAMGALVVADTYAPDEPDLRHIKNYQVGEDLTEKENTKAIMRPGVFARVVAAWREHNPDGLPTLLFGPDVAGSKFFAEQFHRAGIRAAHIDGDDVWLDGETLNSTQDVRDRLLAEYRDGTIKVLCNRFVMREGIDLPETGCMIFATVFGALSSYLQAGGRGLRACPSRNKEKCLCLDHGGNWHRHGSLNAARDWTLGMTNHRVVGERQERMGEGKEPQPIVCPKCGKVRLSGRECPSCHFVAHKRSRMVVQIDGTLRPVDGDIYKPHRVKQYPNTAQLWQRMYYRAKNSRKGMTFRQAEALFLVENHYWPPRDLPFMPREPGDFWRKVSAVPSDSLL